MKIAIAGFNDESSGQLKEVFLDYIGRISSSVQTDFYDDPIMLAAHASEGYDIVILDMAYGEPVGDKFSRTELSRKIRSCNPFIPILYVSRSEGNSCEIVNVMPQYYKIGDIGSGEQLTRAMNSITKSIFREASKRKKCIKLRKKAGGIRVLSLSDIVYAEIADHIIKIHMHGGEIVEMRGTMRSFSQTLGGSREFISPHRSYVVNAVYISEILENEVHLSSSPDVIPIAKGKFAATYHAYRKYFE